MKKIMILLVLGISIASCDKPPASENKTAETTNLDKYSQDRVKVERAVLDYLDALYNADSTLVYRGVSRGLAKIGIGNSSKETTSITDGRRHFKSLVNSANNWNKDNRKVDPKTAIKKVIVYEILNYIASVKLVASWGIDYIHLAKYDGEWKVVNVIYQGHP